MAIFYSKKCGILKGNARKEANQDDTTKPCPTCNTNTKAVESYSDRSIFKCSNCGNVSVYTKTPSDVIKNAQVTTKKQKFSAITIRDRSKEFPKKDNITTKEPTTKDTSQKPNIILDNIRTSMRDTKIIEFKYIKSNGEKASKSVEPYKLDRDKNGNLVLWAYCLENDGIRMFKLGGISKVKLQEYTFKPRWEIQDRLKK